MLPSSRADAQFAMARDGAKSRCSLILDMSGGTPVFTGARHREGYKRVDPADPAAILRAAMELSELVGEFEKPIYVDYNSETCAHSRSKQTGCSKCLDACPAGAISDDGDHVAINAAICGGCGFCHAVCPTGSISYQYPQRADIISHTQALVTNYQKAGGENAVVLIHDERHGLDLISAMARFGRGLPANVLPYALQSTGAAGHVEMASMLAAGAQKVFVLADPRNADELNALQTECDLMNALMRGLGFDDKPRVEILIESDPDKVEAALWEQVSLAPIKGQSFAATSAKRDAGRLAITHLHSVSPSKPEIAELPDQAPYGRVTIDQEACTLCMSCTSACPADAIMDTPGEPTLRFVESACVQCGLCVRTCPENALTLEPRYNFSSSAMQPVVLYQEEPFECISCGKPFATRSTIERISARLAGKHTMFASDDRARILQMCDTCRIEAQANSADDPFQVGSRPKPRTTEDYIEAERAGLSADDFLMDD